MSERGEALTRRYLDRLSATRVATRSTVERLWVRFGGFDDDTVVRFTPRAVAAVAAGSTAAARLVVTYLAMLELVETGRSVPPVDVADLPPARTVPPGELYQRPLGVARAEGTEAARVRAGVMAATDVTLTHRAAAAAALTQSGARVVGYRRALTGESCPLCAAAAVEVYRTGSLMPVHDGCDCGITPVYSSGVDVAAAVNAARVTQLSTEMERLPDVVQRTHGEKGPILVNADHRFNPGD